MQVWGALLIFGLCPLVGGMPLVGWLTAVLTGRDLAKLGTGNISVSAAFYHGGKVAGIVAVLSEALKGIGVVLLARHFFPVDSEWEIIALIGLVMGRYWVGKGAGTTNVVWGYGVHDPVSALFVLLIGGVGFTLVRDRHQSKFGVLLLFPLITLLRHGEHGALVGATICLAMLLGWIYTKMPDDLDLSAETAVPETKKIFRWAQGQGPEGRGSGFSRSPDPLRDRGLRSLDRPLAAAQFGQKAATLAELKRLGYPVPPGWVLLPGDDLALLVERVNPSPDHPVVVRSSAVGEDSETASAAGQYASILQVTSRGGLERAIADCFASYDRPAAQQYRRDRGLADAPMAVLIQPQVRGVFSGVAFSRDPIERRGEAVVIEALPGEAQRIVSGKFTPESYRVWVTEADLAVSEPNGGDLPQGLELPVLGQGETPPRLLQQVAWLSRQLEQHYHGVPQDIEWTFDGEWLWLLQSRPITTLLPIWTRKIAAEVIPGLICPLTWSINRPLTCGVWGQLFTVVLGDRAQGLDFTQTATLHYSQAYFNATLLGDIFRRMGLPAESLEFLTRGARFRKPPLLSTLGNVPGLIRLAGREWRLPQDWQRDWQRLFQPRLADLAQSPAIALSARDLMARIDSLLDLLQKATYYSILAPLSAALRQAIWRVEAEQLDNGATPEVAVVRSLQALAQSPLAQSALAASEPSPDTNRPIAANATDVFARLATTPEGQAILAEFEQILARFDYLSEVGTDIAVPTWREDPQPVRDLFTQFCQQSGPELSRTAAPIAPRSVASNAVRLVQRRVALKGHVTEVYSRLLAELRWSVVALASHWIAAGLLQQPDDIFFLELAEVRHLIDAGDLAGDLTGDLTGDQRAHAAAIPSLAAIIVARQANLDRDRQLTPIPYLVYGHNPPAAFGSAPSGSSPWQATQRVQGIGASAGQIEGRVKIVRTLSDGQDIDRETILVVPYTDSGWAPLLARAGGLISEVGGRLSHGAIVAREYRIPAVMDISHATEWLQDGQRVRIDGQTGVVEVIG
jgi:phosphohistidine swiveling domain-containing protein/glycerol-3-phosphate acyltransferase PlsY